MVCKNPQKQKEIATKEWWGKLLLDFFQKPGYNMTNEY